MSKHCCCWLAADRQILKGIIIIQTFLSLSFVCLFVHVNREPPNHHHHHQNRNREYKFDCCDHLKLKKFFLARLFYALIIIKCQLNCECDSDNVIRAYFRHTHMGREREREVPENEIWIKK